MDDTVVGLHYAHNLPRHASNFADMFGGFLNLKAVGSEERERAGE
jgi:hypothetical protein